MTDVPRDPHVDALVDRFIAAAEHERLALIAELRSVSGSSKQVAYGRLTSQLETRFSLRPEFSAPFTAMFLRSAGSAAQRADSPSPTENSECARLIGVRVTCEHCASMP